MHATALSQMERARSEEIKHEECAKYICVRQKEGK